MKSIFDGLEPVLHPSVPPETLCFSSAAFFGFLERELVQAERYGNYSTLILCQPPAGDPSRDADIMNGMVRCLRGHIRATDFLGIVDKTIAGIVLQNTTVENAGKVSDRLKEEVGLYLSAQGIQGALQLSSAVYPTEANTFDSIRKLAEARLKETIH